MALCADVSSFMPGIDIFFQMPSFTAGGNVTALRVFIIGIASPRTRAGRDISASVPRSGFW
jgi:hypothetical protein